MPREDRLCGFEEIESPYQIYSKRDSDEAEPSEPNIDSDDTKNLDELLR